LRLLSAILEETEVVIKKGQINICICNLRDRGEKRMDGMGRDGMK
jgi:hypothetical protein